MSLSNLSLKKSLVFRVHMYVYEQGQCQQGTSEQGTSEQGIRDELEGKVKGMVDGIQYKQ